MHTGEDDDINDWTKSFVKPGIVKSQIPRPGINPNSSSSNPRSATMSTAPARAAPLASTTAKQVTSPLTSPLKKTSTRRTIPQDDEAEDDDGTVVEEESSQEKTRRAEIRAGKQRAVSPTQVEDDGDRGRGRSKTPTQRRNRSPSPQQYEAEDEDYLICYQPTPAVRAGATKQWGKMVQLEGDTAKELRQDLKEEDGGLVIAAPGQDTNNIRNIIKRSGKSKPTFFFEPNTTPKDPKEHLVSHYDADRHVIDVTINNNQNASMSDLILEHMRISKKLYNRLRLHGLDAGYGREKREFWSDEVPAKDPALAEMAFLQDPPTPGDLRKRHEPKLAAFVDRMTPILIEFLQENEMQYARDGLQAPTYAVSCFDVLILLASSLCSYARKNGNKKVAEAAKAVTEDAKDAAGSPIESEKEAAETIEMQAAGPDGEEDQTMQEQAMQKKGKKKTLKKSSTTNQVTVRRKNPKRACNTVGDAVVTGDAVDDGEESGEAQNAPEEHGEEGAKPRSVSEAEDGDEIHQQKLKAGNGGDKNVKVAKANEPYGNPDQQKRGYKVRFVGVEPHVTVLDVVEFFQKNGFLVHYCGLLEEDHPDWKEGANFRVIFNDQKEAARACDVFVDPKAKCSDTWRARSSEGETVKSNEAADRRERVGEPDISEAAAAEDQARATKRPSSGPGSSAAALRQDASTSKSSNQARLEDQQDRQSSSSREQEVASSSGIQQGIGQSRLPPAKLRTRAPNQGRYGVLGVLWTPEEYQHKLLDGEERFEPAQWPDSDKHRDKKPKYNRDEWVDTCRVKRNNAK